MDEDEQTVSFSIEMSRGMRKRFKVAAAAADMTMQQYALNALVKEILRDEADRPAINAKEARNDSEQ